MIRTTARSLAYKSATPLTPSVCNSIADAQCVLLLLFLPCSPTRPQSTSTVAQRCLRVRLTQQATAPQLLTAEPQPSQLAALQLLLPGHHLAREGEVQVALGASLRCLAALLRMQLPVLTQTLLVIMALASDRCWVLGVCQ
jgi:hypothetical protein